jgi:glycosyltransferase involved in cell wall biosynthesis
MINNLQNKKIAIVCDWIKDWGGAEVVLEQILETFPNADIFSSVFWQQGNPIFEGRKITTSFIQKIPFLNKSHKLALWLRPLAFESFDLSQYDIVISSTSAESKWVITKPETLQVCYCHTPTRYFWSHYHEYLQMMEFGWILNWIGKNIAPSKIHKLRQWDFCAAKRPDYFIANSKNTQSRISKYYKRESEVIYPCLDIKSIPFEENKWDYYFYNGRCIPYKKFDLIVDAFNENWKKIIIATNTDNTLYRELKEKSNNNIEWILSWDLQKLNKLHAKAKAFIFPPEEDFGLVPIAAMASWTPVIAYWKWGALETVVENKTGIFFLEQNIESLNKAIEKFETLKFNAKIIREHAENFDKNIFKKKLINFIEEKINY